MAIYIDSANMADVRRARAYGWVQGVTTNPLLLARSTEAPDQVLRALTKQKFKQIFYQLVSTSQDQMYEETKKVYQIVADALVVKVPPTKASYQFVTNTTNGHRAYYELVIQLLDKRGREWVK